MKYLFSLFSPEQLIDLLTLLPHTWNWFYVFLRTISQSRIAYDFITYVLRKALLFTPLYFNEHISVCTKDAAKMSCAKYEKNMFQQYCTSYIVIHIHKKVIVFILIILMIILKIIFMIDSIKIVDRYRK